MSGEALKAKERGNAAYKKGDFAAAHGHYDEAILLSPREITFYSNKGAAFMEEGKYEDCIAVCLKAVDFGLENKIQLSKAMARTGTAYAKLGNTTEAVKWYEKSLAEHHNPDVAKKVAEMTEILQKTVKTDVTPSPVPRKPLSTAYITAMFYQLFRYRNTFHLAQRFKNVVYSSPTITKYFLDFMDNYAVRLENGNLSFVRSNASLHITSLDAPREPFADKKWDYFTWITPFIRIFVVWESPPPSCMHWILEKAQRFLHEFTYMSSTPPTEAVLSFVRGQMPYLDSLSGPRSFFELIPVGSNKKFDQVFFVLESFNDFEIIFAKKRFAATRLVFLRNSLSCKNTLPLYKVMPFLANSSLRMPETELIAIELEVDHTFVPITEFIQALRTVFTHATDITFMTVYHKEMPILYNLACLEYTYEHCKNEIAKLPDDLTVDFSLDQHVCYDYYGLMTAELRRRHESPNFEFFDNSNFGRTVFSRFGYVGCSQNVGKPSRFTYSVEFEFVPLSY